MYIESLKFSGQNGSFKYNYYIRVWINRVRVGYGGGCVVRLMGVCREFYLFLRSYYMKTAMLLACWNLSRSSICPISNPISTSSKLLSAWRISH